MRIIIPSADGNRDLEDVLPIKGTVVRKLPGNDRPDYSLVALDAPFFSRREQTSISHIVVSARWEGGVLDANMSMTPVNILYVTDESLLLDSRLDFGKCRFKAIGVANGEI
jgi:hypothetical protein